MPVNTVTTSRSYAIARLSNLHNTLTQKTEQLSSGKVSTTYGGIGDNRLLDLELTQKVNRIDSYKETITRANLQLNTMNLTLDRLESLRIDAKSAFDANNFELQTDGQTQTQASANVLLHEATNLLNTEVAGHYIFGGADADTNPVQNVDKILNGDGNLAGLRTYMDEYSQANLGVNNNGRMTVSGLTTNFAGAVPTDSTFTVAEDGAHDFGFDIASVTNNLTNATLTGPGGGDPDSFDVKLTGQPNIGDTFSVVLTLPPAHTENLTLNFKAAADTSQKGNFLIGSDLAQTTQNLHDAISSALQDEAKSTLRATSDKWAADEYFNTYNGAVPQRVAGPPFNTATTLVSGAGTTLPWYTGDNAPTTDPRTDKTAVIDSNLSVNYGARANEDGLASVVKSLATFVASNFSGGTPSDEEYYNKAAQKMRDVIEPSGSTLSGVSSIATQIAIAHRTVEQTDDRHTQMKASYETAIGDIEGVDNNLVATEILNLQTNIQASYRASSIVLQLSLTNYI
ncbi:flagellin [Roseibium aggregatum]|uniref:Flagellar protein n=1 Tax=Roseibium aggregatum TaxID=187304 RepID=A0A926P0Z2_9HYPH|nr:flagellin [Roseibium aggregatum]MBD1547830.1 flagellar protein [Roseibium aggregatum]